MDGALSLDQHGPLGRFDPPVEADYQRWLSDQAGPIYRTVGAVTLPIWLVVPFIVRASTETRDLYFFFAFAWGLAVPLTALGMLNLRRSAPFRPILASAVIVVMIATGNILAYALTVPDIDAGSYMFGITAFCMFAPVLRLPFVTTLVVALLITGTGLALAVGYAAGPVDRLWAGPNASLPLITLVVIPGMALLTERSLRASYVDEQVMAGQRQLIRRYAPSSVVSHIEQGDTAVDNPQRRKVTIFFSDVVGFTTMADRVDPEALAEIVNDYLGSLADLIERHGGTLNEFAGDGVMAIFGAPDELDPAKQVLAAVAAARELQASLPEWSRDWYQHGIVEDAQARIGINTGTISVGTFGSAVRATYTGIGLQTNIAARVQAEAKPGGILLSNTSWHLVKDQVACEPRGEVMVKGVHFPIELYEPIQ